MVLFSCFFICGFSVLKHSFTFFLINETVNKKRGKNLSLKPKWWLFHPSIYVLLIFLYDSTLITNNHADKIQILAAEINAQIDVITEVSLNMDNMTLLDMTDNGTSPNNISRGKREIYL